MSWKGFKKGIVRAPQTFRSKFNIGEITRDPIYEDAGRRFKSLEAETKKLSDDSRKYTDAVNGMLNHQYEFAQACIELYKPISGRASDPESYENEGNAAGIEAAEAYKKAVVEVKAELASELDVIEARIVKPAQALITVIRAVDKLLVKRDHKQLDYDRHRSSLKKLQEKKDRSLKDEKHLYQAETAFEQASQEYEYYNDLLKEELPRLFELETEFIAPLFRALYFMQLNIFWTLYEKMNVCDIAYFNLNTDIVEEFEAKRGDVQARTEALTITHFKTAKPIRKLGAPGSSSSPKNSNDSSRPVYPSTDSSKPAYNSSSKATEAAMDSMSAGVEAPPSYSIVSSSSSPSFTANAPPSTASSAAFGTPPAYVDASPIQHAPAAAAVPPPPPPVPAKPAVPRAEIVTALYDYTAQAPGDLSFQAGDRIEIVSRTNNQNEWWIGRLNGAEGNFPGNYVQL
ncbi:BAR adaptor protein Hob1 [Schizosaccharomyces japonicus yFS275]|uniref:BAR adaptor protein Hob1 n=1 Tax=Schizosaccharomyces japonicus (strain yFS275 / FY16936) TaxID=402676 RepID=B6JXP4_SCHJY|nr:BAR adaptor protein Hob1 [Schizosaccharomyces japonicus yFS275]EEB05188.1 BAR adaptor protein Hob1 [Schizosaccharomyces japonicus yFS275]